MIISDKLSTTIRQCDHKTEVRSESNLVRDPNPPVIVFVNFQTRVSPGLNTRSTLRDRSNQ